MPTHPPPRSPTRPPVSSPGPACQTPASPGHRPVLPRSQEVTPLLSPAQRAPRHSLIDGTEPHTATPGQVQLPAPALVMLEAGTGHQVLLTGGDFLLHQDGLCPLTPPPAHGRGPTAAATVPLCPGGPVPRPHSRGEFTEEEADSSGLRRTRRDGGVWLPQKSRAGRRRPRGGLLTHQPVPMPPRRGGQGAAWRPLVTCQGALRLCGGRAVAGMQRGQARAPRPAPNGGGCCSLASRVQGSLRQ